MTIREKRWITLAVLITAIDLILPYTIFRERGAWLFWTVLSMAVLLGGAFYTAAWVDDSGPTRGRKGQ